LLSERIVGALRQAIIKGQLPPGERIVELSVARQMGTSQGPVREALHRLEEAGLVTSQRHRGTFVTGISLEEMEVIFELRAVAEGHATRRAAHTATAMDISRLNESVRIMQAAAAEGDVETLVMEDMRFHLAIGGLSGYLILKRIWQVLDGQVRRFIYQARARHAGEGREIRELRRIAKSHQPIVEALSAAAPDRAANLMVEHIRLSWDQSSRRVREDARIATA
jgi:DNA-binding GntR family transcriptional regulator